MKVLGVGEPVRLEDKPRNRCRKWQLIVKVDLGDGKRHRKTRTFRGPYTQAVEATGGYAAELAGRSVTGETDISTCIDEFLAHRERTGEVSRRTMRTDGEKLAALRLNLGGRIAETVTRNDIQDMYADIRDGSTPSGNPWAPRSIIRLHTSLKALFGWLAEEGAVAENPMRGIRTPKVKDAGVGRAMPAALMDGLLASLDYSKPMHRAVALALACGLRREECTALSWDDLRDGEVHVAWASEEDGELKEPKNGRARVVPVPEDVYGALDAHRATGPVVGFLPHSVTVWWKKNRDRLGASGYRFHDLRHSWATRFVEADVQTKKIMDLGGWLSEEPLNSIYAHVSGEEKRAAVRKAFGGGADRRAKPARNAERGTKTAQIISLKDRRSGVASS